jgi:hypothetical protein
MLPEVTKHPTALWASIVHYINCPMDTYKVDLSQELRSTLPNANLT